jgi:hypothetical protein
MLGMAAVLIWIGIQGFRGVPDKKGKTTSKPVAVACFVAAALIAVFALVILPWLSAV